MPKASFNSSVTRLDPETFDEIEKQDEAIRDFYQSIGLDTSDLQPTAFEDTYQSSVRVTQPIFNGGKEIAAIHAGTMEKRLRTHAADDARAQTVNNVKKAYFDAQRPRRSKTRRRKPTHSPRKR
ncbi:MAG: TolC family protein [Deltaproteobacteria bacterium]|nr:TolC family protein [Deltaproteobacteria bacterium]